VFNRRVWGFWGWKNGRGNLTAYNKGNREGEKSVE
jgi:hypothetical protein